MTLLAIPPIFTNVYTGIANVDDAYRDAARGLGMTTRQQLMLAEIPIAAPLLITGIRIAVVQVIATATIGAYAGTGGLGRFIIDGFALQDYPQVFGGALLVAVLAILGDRVLVMVERHFTPNSPRV
jgi:osmoprotectant transport system permease protein